MPQSSRGSSAPVPSSFSRPTSTSSVSSRGLSTVGGQTHNPYDLARSLAARAAAPRSPSARALRPAGLATETGISIRGPAANTGIVAIAPSRGLVSRAGVIPISFTQDRVGVRAVGGRRGARAQPIRGFDAEDLVTAESLGRDEASPYRVDPTMTLEGIRIGVLSNLFREGAEFAAGNALVRQQIERLATRGATIVEGCGPDAISWP